MANKLKGYKRDARDIEQDAIALMLNPSLKSWADMHRTARDTMIEMCYKPETVARARKAYRKQAQEATK